MKKTFKQAIHVILLALVFANLFACGGRQSNDSQTDELNNVDTVNLALSPMIQRVIEDFDDYLVREIGDENTDGVLYDISMYKSENGSLLVINEDYYYNEDRITGYTYWKNYTIAYYEFCPECNLEFIDKSRLIPFVDSIPGFQSYALSDTSLDGVHSQTYLIHGPDSLELIYAGPSN